VVYQGPNRGGREVEGRGGEGEGFTLRLPGVPMGSDDETG